jgi:putative glycosyltransferase (TIGR04372 family)
MFNVEFLRYQLEKINEGGIIVLLNKLFKLQKLVVLKIMFAMEMTANGLWAVPFVILIRILQPVLKLRVGTIKSDRIGHFAQDAAEQLARLKKYDDSKEWFWLPKNTCNKQWRKMVKRNLPVYPWVKYLDLWNCLLPGGDKIKRPSSFTKSRDIEGFFEKVDARMEFLFEEEAIAKSWLINQGWSEGEPFVCLLVRDNHYLANDPDHGKGDEHSYKEWEYHSYRNSDISDYVSAMEWLANNGVWVFRMGKIMEKRIPVNHDKIIDYAFHPERNDFLDIWLFANCNLCISTGCGPDFISDIYRKPLLILNYAPISRLWSWSDALHVPKHLKFKNSLKHLNLKEYLEHNYSITKQYENAQIIISNLNSNEILEATQECWERIQTHKDESEEDIRRQKRFWKILKEWPLFPIFHGWVHPKSGIANSWLKNNENEFLNF